MRNLWLIARHEYRKRVSQRSFLLMTLGMPALIAAVMAISILVALGDGEVSLGYVDGPGILDPAVTPIAASEEDEALPPIEEFADESAARAALESGAVDAYYVVPAGYPQAPVDLYYLEDAPGEAAQERFANFLRANLALQAAAGRADVAERLQSRPDLTVRSADSSREVGGPGAIMSFLLPFAAGFFFIFAVMGSAGYLLQVVADEKENRTVEMLLTTISPEQLIGGKALGLMAVALTQIAIWVAAAAVGLVVASQLVEDFPPIEVPGSYLLLIALFFLPAYALVAGLMTAIGGAVTEVRQGQQIAGLLNLLFIVPFFAIALIMARPDSPLVLLLTLFPTTSFLTVAMRWGMSVIPTWQLILSWVLLVASALFSVWAAARIFRAGMLRYGQRMDLQEIWAAIRAPQQTQSAELAQEV